MVDLIEFPADDLERARQFWQGLLGAQLEGRREGEGRGVQTHSGGTELGVHERGSGPGDRVSLPYFRVADLAVALELVVELGGEVIHPASGGRSAATRKGAPSASAAAAPAATASFDGALAGGYR